MALRSLRARLAALFILAGLVAQTTLALPASASMGRRGPSVVTTAAPADTTVPSTPTGLTATAVGSSRIDLSWNGSTDNVGVQGYKVFRDGTYLTSVGPVGSTSFIDTGLSAGTAYTYTVSAIDAAGGTSGQSTAASATTAGPDLAAPSTPTAVSANVQAWNQVTITWAASSDTVGVTSYSVFRNGTKISVVAGSTRTFTDRSTAGSMTYSYTVKASDAAGNTSAASTAAATTTPVDPTVFLTSPWPDAQVFATETLTAEASDPSGVAGVDFLVDGGVIGSDATPPYSLDWDSTSVSDGIHTLTAKKYAFAGGTSSSDPVAITVANSTTSTERVDVDFAAGRLSMDEYLRLGVYAVGAPVALPDRYRSATADSSGSSKIYDYLAVYDQAQQATKDEIDAFLDQPIRGDQYLIALYPGARGSGQGGSAPAAASAPPGIVDDCDWFDFTFVNNPTTGFQCFHRSDHFEVSYVLQGTGDWADDSVAVTDADQNGYPDYIDKVDKGLEDAFDAYTIDLAFPANWLPELIPVLLRPMNGGQVLPQGVRAGSPLDRIQTIEMDVDDGAPFFLAHHETFHVFEYQFVGAQSLGTLISGPALPGFRWWAEASAEWAAGYVTRIGKSGDENAYPHALPDFLGQPTFPLNACSCDGSGREYGSFVFAEYLVERLDRNPDASPKTNPSIMREIWDRIRTVPQDPVDAIEAIVGLHGTTLRDLAPGFARANYFLDYNDSLGQANAVESRWRPTLAGVPATSDPTGFAPPRPARDHRDLVSGQPVFGANFISFGGAGYVELVPPVGAGEIAVSLSGADPNRLDAHLLTVRYPTSNPANETVCIDTPISTDANGNGTVSVPIQSPCRFAVLIFSAIDFTQRVGSEFGWSATWTTPDLDDFNRTAVTGLGTSSSGTTWAMVSGSDASVNGAIATIPATQNPMTWYKMPASPLFQKPFTLTSRVYFVPPQGVQDSFWQFNYELRAGAAGDGADVSLGFTYQWFGQFVGQTTWSAGGGWRLNNTAFTSSGPQRGPTGANAWYLIRWSFDGAVSRVKAWPESMPEPVAWTAEYTLPGTVNLSTLDTLNIYSYATSPASVFRIDWIRVE